LTMINWIKRPTEHGYYWCLDTTNFQDPIGIVYYNPSASETRPFTVMGNDLTYGYGEFENAIFKRIEPPKLDILYDD
jgi:hypothetical protein